jgi:large subunit ribosomal protein L25
VPGVIYGNKEDPLLISVDSIDLMKQLNTPGFFARVYELNVAGQAHRVLARDLQLDSVSDKPIHIDFMRFSATTRLNIDIQVVFENEDACPGLRMGGVLNVVRHSVELRCRPDNIPECLTANLEGLEIGDGIHISAIELPSDVELTITDRDFTIATIASPTVAEETVDVVDGEDGGAGAEAAEGEAADAAEGEAETKA